MKFRLPNPRSFPAFAQAQLWGMAVGFAFAWLASDKWHLSFWGMVLGWAVSWIGWEIFFGRTAPSARKDIAAITYSVFTGFAFPWIGLAFAAIVQAARP
jgi:hypothetical protein